LPSFPGPEAGARDTCLYTAITPEADKAFTTYKSFILKE